MTTHPIATRTALGRIMVDELLVDGELGGMPVEAVFIVGATLVSDNLSASDAGPIRVLGWKATDLIAIDADLADELVLALKRQGRQRVMTARGHEPIAGEEGETMLDGEPSPEDVVRDFLEGGDPFPVDEHQDDGELELEADEGTELEVEEDGTGTALPPIEDHVGELLVDPGSDVPLAELEAAWLYVDTASPGYGDLSEGERRERLAGGRIEPFALRHYLALERVELDGSPFLLKFLEDELAAGLERYATEEPWPGYGKAVVGAIVGKLLESRETDVARGNRPAVLEHVRTYELAHKGRTTVVSAIDEELLGYGPAPEVPAPGADFAPTEDHDAEDE
jgi:hypothetical protein